MLLRGILEVYTKAHMFSISGSCKVVPEMVLGHFLARGPADPKSPDTSSTQN